MKKVYDLVVKVGEYTDRSGQTKGRYENIGAIMEGDKGPFMFLKRTFNPAGINSDKESILVSMFAPKPKDGILDGEVTNTAPPVSDIQNPFSDDDIPF
jgi:hypothetical protein